MTDAPSPVRVLWIVKGLGPGGAERLLVEHASAGDHQAFRYEVAYLLSWKQHLVAQVEAHGVKTRCLGVRTELDPRWVWRLARLLRRERYDVVHAHSPIVGIVARVLVRTMPRARRPALVYTEHNRWQSYRRVTRIANRLTYRANDAVFAVSSDVRDSVDAAQRERVEVLVHGVDVAAVRSHLAERDAVRAELGARGDEVLSVTVANLRATKNYPGLLVAAQLVIDRRARNGQPAVQFAAAGQGPLEAEIRALHAELGLGDRFRVLGYRDDATRLVAGADLFVLASHHEGLPVTVMEALTLGVPVVAPDVGGLREVITSGENGILVQPESARALAEAIEKVADPTTRARLAAGARTTGERFSSATAVARMEECYRALVG